jgi:hypothetical protein
MGIMRKNAQGRKERKITPEREQNKNKNKKQEAHPENERQT